MFPLCEKFLQEFKKKPLEQSNILNGISCFSFDQILFQHKFIPISEPPKQETI